MFNNFFTYNINYFKWNELKLSLLKIMPSAVWGEMFELLVVKDLSVSSQEEFKVHVNGPRWDILIHVLLKMLSLSLWCQTEMLKKSSHIHQYLPTKAKQTHTANHFCAQLKNKNTSEIVSFLSTKPLNNSNYKKNK